MGNASAGVLGGRIDLSAAAVCTGGTLQRSSGSEGQTISRNMVPRGKTYVCDKCMCVFLYSTLSSKICILWVK